MAVDILGREIKVGDKVVYLTFNYTSSELEVGIVEKLNPKTLVVDGKRRAYNKVVVVEREEM